MGLAFTVKLSASMLLSKRLDVPTINSSSHEEALKLRRPVTSTRENTIIIYLQFIHAFLLIFPEVCCYSKQVCNYASRATVECKLTENKFLYFSIFSGLERLLGIIDGRVLFFVVILIMYSVRRQVLCILRVRSIALSCACNNSKQVRLNINRVVMLTNSRENKLEAKLSIYQIPFVF